MDSEQKLLNANHFTQTFRFYSEGKAVHPMRGPFNSLERFRDRMKRFADQARDLVNDFDELFKAFKDIVIPDFVLYVKRIRNNMIQTRERYT
jgi:hypothetical protein